MHDLPSVDDSSAKGLADALQAKADAQQWHLACKLVDHVETDAGFVWCAGAWRQDNALWRKGGNFIYRYLVVTNRVDVVPQLAKILNEVVGKRVVVVDHQQHGTRPPMSEAVCVT